MQTILRIIERAGGWNPGLFLKIENAPYRALTIEAIEESPSGLPTVSVTHYGEQNGDLTRRDQVPRGYPHARVIARLIRIPSGNLRLLTTLLTR